MEVNNKICDTFDILPDEIIIHIMSYFDDDDRVWIFGFLSQRFFQLIQTKTFEIKLGNNVNDLGNKLHQLLYAKEITMCLECFVVCLKSSRNKIINTLSLVDELAYTLIVTIDQWQRENKLLAKAIHQVGNKCRNFKLVHFDYVIHRTDELVHGMIRTQSNLLHLNLSNCYTLGDNGIKSAEHCKRLKFVTLSRCVNVTDTGIKCLTKNCKELTNLDLTLCNKITNDGIITIAQNLKLLQSIVLKGLDISDKAVEAIANSCQNLQKIDLTNCRQITDSGVAALSSKCRMLRELNVEECFKITDESVKVLSNECLVLSVLSLAGCHDITNKSLGYLEDLKTLNSLDVRFCNKLTLKNIIRLINVAKLNFMIISTDMMSTDTSDCVLGRNLPALQIKNILI